MPERIEMSIYKLAVLVVVAILCGFLGAELDRLVMSYRSQGEPIRSSRFELINAQGEVVSSWGTNEEGEGASLSFRSRSKSIAVFGVQPGDLPFLDIRDHTGRVRATLRGNEDGSATLYFDDGGREGVVKLGSIRSDTPTPRERSWGLVVNGFLGYCGHCHCSGARPTEG